MRHSYRLLLSAMLTLWPTIAHALPDQRDTYTVVGLGAASCEYWTNETQGTEDLEDTARGSWVLGYITAVNLFASGSSDVTRGRETKHIWAWIDVYCAEHPFDTIAVAAEALVSESGQADSSLSGRGQ